jgi:hypothetical protein
MTAAERDPDLSRRMGNRAFNKAKTFFEDYHMILQKIEQENDIGIDAILVFTRRGPDAGRYINLQIKGGRSYKRKTHVDDLYAKRKGMTSLRSVDWRLWGNVYPSRGSEGHHIIHVNERLKTIWSNARPTYAIVQDADDDELYFGNLTRMVDMEPLDQDLADVYERMRKPNDGSIFHKYLASTYERISTMSEAQRRDHKTRMSLYPDLRITPDGLDRFLEYALPDARKPLPDRQHPSGEQVETIITYPDGTIGPSREALDLRARRLANS